MGEEEEGKGSGVGEMQTSQVGKKAWQCENGVCVACVQKQASWMGPTWDCEDVLLSGRMCVCNVLQSESL